MFANYCLQYFFLFLTFCNKLCINYSPWKSKIIEKLWNLFGTVANSTETTWTFSTWIAYREYRENKRKRQNLKKLYFACNGILKSNLFKCCTVYLNDRERRKWKKRKRAIVWVSEWVNGKGIKPFCPFSLIKIIKWNKIGRYLIDKRIEYGSNHFQSQFEHHLFMLRIASYRKFVHCMLFQAAV